MCYDAASVVILMSLAALVGFIGGWAFAKIREK